MIDKTLLRGLIVNMSPRGMEDGEKNPRTERGGSVDTGVTIASENGGFLRNRAGSANIWRPSSLINLVNPIRKRGSAVFDSTPTPPTTPTSPTSSTRPITPTSPSSPDSPGLTIPTNGNAVEVPKTNNSNTSTALVLSKSERKEKLDIKRKQSGAWSTLVSIILVEAKGLPSFPTDGASHGVYCKLRLGSQTLKSKSVQNKIQPAWRERLQLHLFKDHLLRLSVWDKGKKKTFMGSAVLDLSKLEQERTHEVWQQLDDGYGLLHLSITICNIRKRKYNNIEESEEMQMENKFALLNPSTEWKLIGQLYVKVISAKGLGGKPSAYCSLEVDNERVRTHSVRSSAEPTWNKNFVFNVYDVTSTLDLKVYDSSIMNALHTESLGRISIPLLRIRNGEMKWYALKDKNNRNSAKGNCPRVLLEMSLFWNPIKASLRIFQPREVKYIKKSQKFDISLVYKNIELVRDVFVFLIELNESYKRLFEWENPELSIVALTGWLLFWYHFKLWATPLLLLAPFLYFWIFDRHNQKTFKRGYGIIETADNDTKTLVDKIKTERSLTDRIQELPQMTLTITDSIDYLGSLSEKLYNLASFKVPFLSYITMILLIVASAGFYFIPFNYLMMIFGIYKFSRNYLRSEKIFNNDLEDFISRIPDTDILNDWRELNVPEPAATTASPNGINVASDSYTVKGSIMY